jgi:hypothetical protein
MAAKVRIMGIIFASPAPSLIYAGKTGKHAILATEKVLLIIALVGATWMLMRNKPPSLQ